ncbi:MAG: methyltransferase [Treponema sp.]|nr:methyltransferase [Treponema sp.]
MSLVKAYQTNEAEFTFRGRVFTFALSHGLFSSANIDIGTRFLLKVFSQKLDELARDGKPMPQTILDAGCGVGVIGICAASVLSPNVRVRCQDRDELARVFTSFNAENNHIPQSLLSAHAEPLLAGPDDAQWDLILSNIPAKAGKPVLEDFIDQSIALLAPEGRVLVVVVNPLANFFRIRICQSGTLLYDETSTSHTVLMYGQSADKPLVAHPPRHGDFWQSHPAYRRNNGVYLIEDVSYTLDTIHGVADFDTPSEVMQVAAKLIRRLKCPLFSNLLIHEPNQGHFPAWLARFEQWSATNVPRITLSGRNVLALEASRHNLSPFAVDMVPALDISPRIAVADGRSGFSVIIAFPELVPRTDTLAALWEGIAALLAPDGLALIALGSSGAERFDRCKPKQFRRVGNIKRKGFRALAYQN